MHYTNMLFDIERIQCTQLRRLKCLQVHPLTNDDPEQWQKYTTGSVQMTVTVRSSPRTPWLGFNVKRYCSTPKAIEPAFGSMSRYPTWREGKDSPSRLRS